MSDKKYPNGKHPNSLKNLVRAWDSESAKEAQLKGAKARSANAKLRNELKASMKQWKEMQEELANDKLDSVEVLRIIAHQKLEDGDTDGAVDIFKSIAEYEKPKLARVESKVEEIKADELTDEELNAKLNELLGKNAD